MRATTHHRPYQGYPYLEPPVHDAPSIDQATASRWANLPRRQVALPVTNSHSHGDRLEETKNDVIGIPSKEDDQPVVYIDMPEGSSHVSLERPSPDNGANSSTHRDENKRDPDVPTVYIDLPEDGTTGTQDMPKDEPEFVQETIFFSPFENRRMEMNKERGSDSEDDTVSTVSGQSTRQPRLPVRPNTLDLYGAGTSGVSTSTPLSSIPPLLSKETLVYGQNNDDRFPASPIPVSEFPEPPPAYTEIDARGTTSEPVTDQPRIVDTPRTQVILPRDHINASTPIGAPNVDRKYLNCHHCGMRVHTLVVRENGFITHATAICCLFICMLPVVAFIYCTDSLKVKNHYCPSCNKVIGYELPCTDNKIIYVN